MQSGSFTTPNDTEALDSLEKGVEFVLASARSENAGTNAAVAETPGGHTLVIMSAEVEDIPEALRTLAGVIERQGGASH